MTAGNGNAENGPDRNGPAGNGNGETGQNDVRHFLDLDQLSPDTLRTILNQAHALKIGSRETRPLAGMTLAMIFEKPSTRTRVSFQVAMQQLGGDVVVISNTESQLGRGETVADTARVLSRYVDAIMIRTNDAAKLQEMSENASVPVINGLTDASHPCQLMADVMTFEEHRGDISGRTIAWVGDGNNMARSWVQAAAQFDFTLRIATPAGRRVDQNVILWARDHGAEIIETSAPDVAVAGVDAVITDTWISMGSEDSNVHNLFMPFQVTEELLAKAASDAIFMHCLPAHRGEEMTDGVIDGPQSVVFDEAENRLHAQKGILSWSLLG